MNTYAYKITNMQRDIDGVVVAASFEIDCSDGVDVFTYSGHTALTKPTAPVVPFEQLAEQEVITWVRELVGKASEEQADAELLSLKSNKTIVNGMPW